MFYDERIHAGRGKAFRNTIILAVVLLAVYGAIHTACLFILHDTKNPLAFIIEPLCLAAGLAILIYGETAYGGKDRDEMREYQKNCYYAKAFYVFLYIFAGVYCVFAPIQSAFLLDSRVFSTSTGAVFYTGFFKPNLLLFVVEIPCFLFLLLQFKRSEMPFNAAFLAEDRSVYWRRVWKNILKFGGYCALYTLGSFAASILYLAINSETTFVIDIGLPFSVLLAGVLTWLEFSLEYFIFSAAERSSDRAVQRGQISGATMAFCWAGYGLSLAVNLVYFVLGLLGQRHAVQTVKLTSGVLNPFAELASYLIPLFFIYLLSELLPLHDRGLNRIGYIYVIVSMMSIPISKCIYPIAATSSIVHSFEKTYSLRFYIQGFQMLINPATAVLLVLVISRLYKNGLTSKWYCALPILPIAYMVVGVLPEMGFLLNSWAQYAVSILVDALYIVMYVCLRRKLCAHPLPVGDPADGDLEGIAPESGEAV